MKTNIHNEYDEFVIKKRLKIYLKISARTKSWLRALEFANAKICYIQ